MLKVKYYFGFSLQLCIILSWPGQKISNKICWSLWLLYCMSKCLRGGNTSARCCVFLCPLAIWFSSIFSLINQNLSVLLIYVPVLFYFSCLLFLCCPSAIRVPQISYQLLLQTFFTSFSFCHLFSSSLYDKTSNHISIDFLNLLPRITTPYFTHCVMQ